MVGSAWIGMGKWRITNRDHKRKWLTDLEKAFQDAPLRPGVGQKSTGEHLSTQGPGLHFRPAGN